MNKGMHAAVTVVVPAYKAEPYLGLCLDSVLAQTIDDWVCVVVDDGSPDETGVIADRYASQDPRFSVVHQQNLGLPGARNSGIDAAGASDFIMFVDADDELLPDAFAGLSVLLEARPDAVGSYGTAEYIDENGRELGVGPTHELHSARQKTRRRIDRFRTVAVGLHEDVTLAEMTTRNPIWPPAVVMFRTKVVHQIGYFQRKLGQVEDQDYLLRASRLGPFVFLDQRVASYRQHTTQMTKDRGEFWYFSDLVRYDSFYSPENSPAQRQAILRSWRAAQVRRVARCGVRVVSAARHGDLTVCRSRLRGLTILVAQLLRNRPPAPARRHIELTGRGV